MTQSSCMMDLGGQDVTTLHELIKHALKVKIINEMTIAQKVIANFLRNRQEKLNRRFFRKLNLFDATVYLESVRGTQTDDDTNLNINCSEFLSPASSVSIIGEFSPENPWEVPIPCVYDETLGCFKVDIMIRTK